MPEIGKRYHIYGESVAEVVIWGVNFSAAFFPRCSHLILIFNRLHYLHMLFTSHVSQLMLNIKLIAVLLAEFAA
jgi:hypothetical protein